MTDPSDLEPVLDKISEILYGLNHGLLEEPKALRLKIDWLRARLTEALQERDAEAACAIRWQGLQTFTKQQLNEARARIATLEEGLRPFAELDRQMPDNRSEDRVWYSYVVGDLRRAATLLANDKPAPAPSEEEGLGIAGYEF